MPPAATEAARLLTVARSGTGRAEELPAAHGKSRVVAVAGAAEARVQPPRAVEADLALRPRPVHHQRRQAADHAALPAVVARGKDAVRHVEAAVPPLAPRFEAERDAGVAGRDGGREVADRRPLQEGQVEGTARVLGQVLQLEGAEPDRAPAEAGVGHLRLVDRAPVVGVAAAEIPDEAVLKGAPDPAFQPDPAAAEVGAAAEAAGPPLAEEGHGIGVQAQHRRRGEVSVEGRQDRPPLAPAEAVRRVGLLRGRARFRGEQDRQPRGERGAPARAAGAHACASASLRSRSRSVRPWYRATAGRCAMDTIAASGSRSRNRV